jgi:hypothetical protein
MSDETREKLLKEYAHTLSTYELVESTCGDPPNEFDAGFLHFLTEKISALEESLRVPTQIVQ